MAQRPPLVVLAAAVLGLVPAVGFGQATQPADGSSAGAEANLAEADPSQAGATGQATDTDLEEVVVTATRNEKPYSELTRSVTVLDRQTLDQQSAISRDLGDILGKTVPGFGTSTEGLTNFTQTLRGRKFLTMVDGVPVSIPLSDSARDLKVIDPEALERVEVIRGGTAIYGFGATGGLVNYITRDPVDEKLSGYSEAGFGFSTEHPDGSMKWHTAQGVSGQAGPVDFLINASFAQRNRFFDSEGERLPPDPRGNQGGLADTDEWSVLGKVGYDFDKGTQRFEVMGNYYDIEQDTDFVTAAGDVSAGRKARGVPGEPRGNSTETKNELVNLTYEHRDVLGSRVKVQAYHLDYRATFPITQFETALAGDGLDESGATSVSEKIGSRLTINTPILPRSLDAKVTWGVDFLNERTAEPVVGTNEIGTASIPEMDQDALAGFAQLEVPVGEIGRVTGGVRHEAFWLDVPTFSSPDGSNTVRGGELTYNETLFNLTGVTYLTDEIDLFGGFSQGYSISDVGGVLQSAGSDWAFPGGTVSANNLDPQAQKVDNYELGLRGNWDWLRGSIVGFYSETDLGTTFETFGEINRQPEEIWGIESSLEADLHKQWTVGGTATWIDDRTDTDGDGDLDDDLPNTRVPPFKLTGFLEYRPTDWWSNRLQALYSGDRNPDSPNGFGGQVFGAGDVDSFVIVDYYASFKAGPGDLRLGVENVLNEDYFPVAAQAAASDSGYSKGQGRTVSLSYQVNW
jgi:iron complex outermembrane receptor protein